MKTNKCIKSTKLWKNNEELLKKKRIKLQKDMKLAEESMYTSSENTPF